MRPRRYLGLVLMAWLLATPLLGLAAGPAGQGAYPPRPGQPESGGQAKATASLVPPADRISEGQARLALARLRAQSPEGLAEAADLLGLVLAQEPANAEARAELALVLARLGRTGAARAEMDRALALRPDDPGLLMASADLEASLGHAVACRAGYQKALTLLPAGEARQAAALRLGAAASLWGDFNLGEASLRQALEGQPGDLDLRLKLAQTLSDAQRYEEAEAIQRELLLERPDLPPALAGLAEIKSREDDHAAALVWCQRLLEHQPDHPQGLRLRAQALFKLQRLDQAGQAFLQAARRLGRPAEVLVGLGRVRLAQGRPSTAQALFAQALQREPGNIAAQFWQSGAGQGKDNGGREKLLQDQGRSALELTAWGDLYAGQGLRGPAAACYRAALARDPACFPAALNLAETLASDHQYQPSQALLRELDAQIPDNRKVVITWARVLSWSRDYEQSLRMYQRARELNPADPVPVMEAARVAAWAKLWQRSQETYASLTHPPVDRLLAGELERLARGRPPDEAERLLALARQAGGEGVYQGYERVSAAEPWPGLNPAVVAELRRGLARLSAAYRLQKTASLESRAKALAWDLRPLASLETYEQLVAFRPGNQEARFDLAQAQCALGLCDREARSYRQLLALDPLHSLAGQALRQRLIRDAPALRAGYSFWKETGRGELSQMERSRADLGLEWPLSCRFNLRLLGHRWLESPRDYGGSAEAFGHTLGLEGQVTPRLRAGASWTHKDYQRADLADRDSGQAEAWYLLAEGLHLGAGFNREDLLANAFALAQGTQREAWWLGIRSDLNRDWSLEGRAAWLDYNDGNRGAHHHLELGRAFSAYPRAFRISLRADYRDTDQPDLYTFQGPILADIRHPYWAPQDNLAGTLILQWRHDLGRQLFCGAPRHYYDLRLNLGTDSENNPAASLEAQWFYEFAERWTAEAKGLVHRSREWDAQGLWLNLAYRF